MQIKSKTKVYSKNLPDDPRRETTAVFTTKMP